MPVFDDVFDGLTTMTLPQLLLAFLACIGYALSQGRLLGTGQRRLAAGIAVSSAAGFVILASDWMAATMLVAFAVAGIGIFVALAWLLSRLVDLSRGTASTPDVPSVVDAQRPVAAGSDEAAARRRRRHAHSL